MAAEASIPVLFEFNPRTKLWIPIESDKTAIMQTLPTNLRAQMTEISVNPEGQIVYPDGSIGSPLIEMTNYLRNKTQNKPLDAEMFLNFVPKQAQKINFPSN